MIGLRQRIAKVTLVSLVACVAVAAILAAAAYWRLSQGPVSLSLLRDKIRATVSEGLGGLPVEIADVVLERDSRTGRTNIRARDLKLFDANGILIAKAPRAAIELNSDELLSANIVPIGLTFIGPNIKVRRLISGDVRLGFGDAIHGLRGTALGENTKGDALQPTAPDSNGQIAFNEKSSETDNAGLIEYIKSEFLSETGSGAAATIRSISISRAGISLYDEENDAIWHAPEVNLAFKKAGFGASLFVDGSINSSGNPWRVDMVANYRRESGDYSLTARFHDLIPANMSRQTFMLSKLTKVQIPLSGRLDLEFNGEGNLKAANAELSAARGLLNFPDILSKPVAVDEGLLRLRWEPQSKAVLVSDSTIVVGGVQTSLAGKFSPHRNAEGRMDTVRFEVKTRAGQNAKGTIDRVDAVGTASLERGRVDLHDMLIMSKQSGVRLRGVFSEGAENISIALAGRVHDVPLEMLQNLWSPILAPTARIWVKENITSGHLTGGSFTVNLPGKILKAALEEKKPLPDSAVKVNVDFSGVTSNYYAGQPPFENLKGKILITGDRMALTSLKGHITDAGGKRVLVSGGRMDITELANPVSQGDFKVQLAGSLTSFFDLADRKPLRFIFDSGFDPKEVKAQVKMDLRVRLPLIENRPRGSSKVSANVELAGLSVANAARGLPLSDGRLKLRIDNNGVKGAGPIKLAGIPAKLNWAQKIHPANAQTLKLETTLSPKQQKKLGIDLTRFINGPIKFKIEGGTRQKSIDKVSVTADLSKTKIRLDAIHWRLADSAVAKATFDADFSKQNIIRVSKLRMKGRGFAVHGGLTLGSAGEVVSAELPLVQLGQNNRFGLKVSRDRSNKFVLDVDGKTFDARPMIAALFDETTSQLKPTGDDQVEVRAKFDSVYAYRNQHLVNVRTVASAKGQALNSMRLSGIFTDRTNLDLVIEPKSDGSRSMKLRSTNAGAALRASNLYTKVQGGQLDFTANLGRAGDGTIRRGDLVVRRFIVANEKELVHFRRDPNANRQNEPLQFDRLTLPFAVDRDFVRIGDAKIQGLAIGALAKGSIRKADGKLSIGGTLIPAYGLNSALSNLPLLGLLLAGGKGEGVIGVTFGLRGTMKQPKVKINPVSAIAPGFLRKMFEFKGRGALDQKAPRKLGKELTDENR